MEGTVNITDFMAHLRDNRLVIVSEDLVYKRALADAEEAKAYQLRLLRQKLMRKNAIPFADVIKAGFFDLTSIQGLKHWVNAGKFSKGEAYTATNGHWMLMTSALKRMGVAE